VGVDVVVCAHNEEEHLAGVLHAIRGSRHAGQLIVVCDACNDNTPWIAAGVADQVVEIPAGNKGTAMAEGLARVTSPHMMFVDADLRGLTPGHIDMLATYPPAEAMVVGLRGETPSGRRSGWMWIAKQVPAVSGERRLPTEFARSVPLAGAGWEAETRINAAAAKAGLPWRHVVMQGVRNRTKPTVPWATEFGHVLTALATYGPELARYALHPQGSAAAPGSTPT
jgi:glycosyltransferase involved in cell wall biosynthesis